MKKLIFLKLTIIVVIAACCNTDNTKSSQPEYSVNLISKLDTVANDKTTETENTGIQGEKILTKLTVLVLPPYDEVANGGFSPNIQEYLETEISKDTSLTLIRFPYKQLMHVPYQNVFDKKYCKPITDKIKTDVIVMSKLDLNTKTGEMLLDKWNFKIRIYYPNFDKQTNSRVTADNVTENEIKNILAYKRQDLTNELKNYR